MARMNIVFVPTQTSNGTAGIDLADIPEDIQLDIEDVYKALKTSTGRMRIAFDTAADAKAWESMAKAYCAQRMVDGKPAPIAYRASPVKGRPANLLEFKVKDIETAETTEINAAVDAVKEAAKLSDAEKTAVAAALPKSGKK